MRILLGSVALALTVAIGIAPAPAHAGTSTGTTYGNLADLLSPEITDPLIALLAPLPTPYKPYTGTVCQSGAPSCIDDVVAQMQSRLATEAATCDHDAVFELAYLRVTQNVQAATQAGFFRDRTWLTQIDAVFADKYFKTMDAWHSGNRSAIAPAWKIALQAADDRTMSGLGDFMLGMNAHINNDFPYVLAEVGLTGADGISHKADHNAYNDRLDTLYYPVFDEETARFDPRFNQVDLDGLDLTLVAQILRGWREVVWRNAEALANAPALLQPLVRAEISAYAASQAALIKMAFGGQATARDAYCATHHG